MLFVLFQNASFVYNPSMKSAEPKEINSDVLFREGQNLMVLSSSILSAV